VKSRHVTALAGYAELRGEFAGVADSIRLAAARSVNALMTAAYWEVGRRIVEFEQGGEGRAGYGEALIKRLGEDLSRRFGRGFGWRKLSQMRAFYLTSPAEQILQTLSAKSPPPAIVPTPSAISPANEASAPRARSFLSLGTLAQAFPLPWSAYVRLLSLKNPTPAASTKQKRCAADGRCANWTARLEANSTSACALAQQGMHSRSWQYARLRSAPAKRWRMQRRSKSWMQ
jgi:hypothetical protein